jgi:hypothetical protein
MLRPPATQYSRYRTNWYVGFGLGGGAGWVTPTSGQSSDSRGGVAFILKAGFVVSPSLLLGVEGSAWRYQPSQSNAWVQFNHYDFMVTWFPGHDSGFYVKSGVGAGVAMLGYSDGYATRQTEAGFDWKGGLGYEWQLMQSFNLGLDMTYGVTAYSGGQTNDLAFNLTFSWY